MFLWVTLGSSSIIQDGLQFFKGLKLKVRKFQGLIVTFVEGTGRKLVGEAFFHNCFSFFHSGCNKYFIFVNKHPWRLFDQKLFILYPMMNRKLFLALYICIMQLQISFSQITLFFELWSYFLLQKFSCILIFTISTTSNRTVSY